MSPKPGLTGLFCCFAELVSFVGQDLSWHDRKQPARQDKSWPTFPGLGRRQGSQSRRQGRVVSALREALNPGLVARRTFRAINIVSGQFARLAEPLDAAANLTAARPSAVSGFGVRHRTRARAVGETTSVLSSDAPNGCAQLTADTPTLVGWRLATGLVASVSF